MQKLIQYFHLLVCFCFLPKVYDQFDTFRVNDVVEFIGILSVDPELANLPGHAQNG